MRILTWPLAVALLAGCAESPGSPSGDDGGGTPADATDEVERSDASVASDASKSSDAASADSGDGPSGDGPTASTFCQTQGPVAFCADFDETDIQTAFVGGLLGTWTNYANPPSLDATASFSKPQSAHFASTLGDESLTFTPNVSPPLKSFSIQAQVRIDQTDYPNSSVFFVLQIDPTHTVNAGFYVGGVQGVTFAVSEKDSAADGGPPSVTHTVTSPVALSVWHVITVGVDPTTLTVTMDTGVSLATPRAQAVAITTPSATLAFGGGSWKSHMDNVIVRTQ